MDGWRDERRGDWRSGVGLCPTLGDARLSKPVPKHNKGRKAKANGASGVDGKATGGERRGRGQTTQRGTRGWGAQSGEITGREFAQRVERVETAQS